MRGVVYRCGACPYLPDREFHAFHPVPNPPAEPSYRQLMDWRFRRSGGHLYMPMCPSCDACRPIRVDVAAFAPRDDQRRCAARNTDLIVTWQERGLDAERAALYRRYQMRIHGKETEEDPSEFLVADGGVPGGELHARDAEGRLLAVSVCDRIGDALSSVYCYYDPDQSKRSLGTFMGLAEIAHCREHGLRWLYLGFLVHGCAKMEYKARFRPHEVLEHGEWKRYA
ncbi:MAG: arginyltransferase [Planctomycetes bacterium]|nr:arginyltransferase [Planctomycetota bacterium]